MEWFVRREEREDVLRVVELPEHLVGLVDEGDHLHEEGGVLLGGFFGRVSLKGKEPRLRRFGVADLVLSLIYGDVELCPKVLVLEFDMDSSFFESFHAEKSAFVPFGAADWDAA